MLEIGSLVDGKYKILNRVGQGGMSVVYLAMNEKANKQWAVKEVRKDGVLDFEAVKQGLVAETDILKKLNQLCRWKQLAAFGISVQRGKNCLQIPHKTKALRI